MHTRIFWPRAAGREATAMWVCSILAKMSSLYSPCPACSSDGHLHGGDPCCTSRYSQQLILASDLSLHLCSRTWSIIRPVCWKETIKYIGSGDGEAKRSFKPITSVSALRNSCVSRVNSSFEKWSFLQGRKH